MDGYPVEIRRRILETEMDNFIKEVNPNVKLRFNQALKNALIESLLDGTVFAIVDSLKDLQHMRES